MIVSPEFFESTSVKFGHSLELKDRNGVGGMGGRSRGKGKMERWKKTHDGRQM